MSSVDRNLLASLALHMLEELALRRGNRVKVKYWKTYRLAEFWLGSDVAQAVLKRLVEGGYVKIEGAYVVLLKPFKPSKTLNEVLKSAYNLLATARRQ